MLQLHSNSLIVEVLVASVVVDQVAFDVSNVATKQELRLDCEFLKPKYLAGLRLALFVGIAALHACPDILVLDHLVTIAVK